MSWQCFVLHGTDRHRLDLRRYHSGRECPGPGGYHQAAVPMGEIEMAKGPDGYYGEPKIYGDDDPRWPTTCAACGYRFTDDDPKQHFTERIYVADDGREFTLRDAPIGAMWRAEWLEDVPSYIGPDGQSLILMCPPGGSRGLWHIDGPASNGPGWTRTGMPPMLTARPSIHIVDYYHGWLTDGVLSDDLDGHTYE